MLFYDYLPEWLFNSVVPLLRWLHIIGSTLIVGGTLFYEFVVPIAIEDLKEEQQLAVFARVRWVFAKVVWVSVALLMSTGIITSLQSKGWYEHDYPFSKPWWIGHTTLGLITLAIALRLTLGRRVPPISWMRVNLIFLLVVLFLAAAARHVRITVREKRDRQVQQQVQRLWSRPQASELITVPTTAPATAPAESPTTIP